MEKMDYELTEYNSENYLDYLNSIKYPWYERVWDTIKEIFDLHKHFFHLRLFYQRHTRGWDDSDTWDMDVSFFKWAYSRLKRFKDLTVCYPEEYGSMENWIKELETRIEQLRRIIEIDDFDFPYHEYLERESIEKLQKSFGKKIPDQIDYNMTAKRDCEKNFLEWWKNNLFQLWW